MELLLFIYALECGLIGEPENRVEPVIYTQVEAGLQYDILTLTGGYYFEPDITGNTADNQRLFIKLVAESENLEAGFIYDISIYDRQGLFTAYVRIGGVR